MFANINRYKTERFFNITTDRLRECRGYEKEVN